MSPDPNTLPRQLSPCYSPLNLTSGNTLMRAFSFTGAFMSELRGKSFDWAERQRAHGCQGTARA